MHKSMWSVFAGLCGLAIFAVGVVSSGAQMSEVKEKPPMFSYVANWQIPRAQWAEMENVNQANKAIMDKALADGTIIGFGKDQNLVHSPDAETHDNWWSAMSIAGLIKVLDQLHSSGTSSSPALASATKHWDLVFVSRYYNWRSGPWKNGYVHVSSYKLKPDAPDDAVDMLSKHLIVPLMEKMLADGTILEYEVDTDAIHTSAPGQFSVVYVASVPEGIDKVSAAIIDAQKEHPLGIQAFGSMTDYSAHRDELLEGDGAYK